MLGLGVLALSPPPPPPSVSIASYVHAIESGSDERITTTISRSPPPAWSRRKGQAEALISASLAGGIGVRPTDVMVEIRTPSMYGLVPRSGAAERGQMTIIDVPASLRLGRAGPAFDVNRFLRDEAVRVPPFIATVRQADGRFLQLRPRQRVPTPWQLRLLVIFGLSIAAVAPLAWFGARRWTDSIRRLAARVDSSGAELPGSPVASVGDAQEIRVLENAFVALHGRLRAQLEDRMQMLMAVAHDLRTPLTSLRVRTEDVAAELRTGFIRDLARLGQMIDGVLAFARAQKLQAKEETIDLFQLVGDLVADARSRGDQISVTGKQVFVSGSALDLSRAVDNLLTNARRYASCAAVTVTDSADQAILCVLDDGPGVPEQMIPRLTEPFFRVERSRSLDTGGIGLGLATVAAIVRSHGGSLEFGNVDGGFKAEVRLPAQPA
jgi:signal transduction histidine kinase